MCWYQALYFALLVQGVLFFSLWKHPLRGRFRLFWPRVVNGFSKERLVVAFLLLCFSVFCFYSHGFLDGSKRSTVIVDELHSSWEPFYGEYGRVDDDPVFSENNYRSFLRWMSRYWDVELLVSPKKKVASNLEAGVRLSRRSTLGEYLLKGSVERKILIVKCVTKAFEEREIDIVESFVRRGGGLFLVGEHTDVLFMNRNLNPLSQRFGITFEEDSVYNLDGDWCTSRREDMAHHPGLHYLDDFYWANGCSLSLSHPARPLIMSPWASFTEEANYYRENFFGNKLVDKSDQLGRRAIAATARLGKGKVIAWTDSTCFNNQLFFTYGRRRLIRGFFAWFELTGLPLGRVLALFLLCLALFVLKRGLGTAHLLWSLSLLLPLSIALGGSLALWSNDLMLSQKKALRKLPSRTLLDASHEPRPALVFEGRGRWQDGVASLLPIIGDLGRLPFFPEVYRGETIARGDLLRTELLVIAGPQRAYREKEQTVIADFVSQGGGLLLIEGAGSSGAINSLASCFGMEFAPGHFDFSAAPTTLINPTIVDGGEALLILDGKPVVAFASHGRGLVLCFGDDWYFAHENEDRKILALDRLFYDMTWALTQGDARALRAMPWSKPMIQGFGYE